jgi:predicted  nucleic acid-binding Zn-ribbon protein
MTYTYEQILNIIKSAEQRGRNEQERELMKSPFEIPKSLNEQHGIGAIDDSEFNEQITSLAYHAGAYSQVYEIEKLRREWDYERNRADNLQAELAKTEDKVRDGKKEMLKHILKSSFHPKDIRKMLIALEAESTKG